MSLPLTEWRRVQMVMQLAYFLTYGKPVACYEAAAVRRFDLGRTETVRVTSKETVAFTKAMTDPSKSNNERKELFRLAVAQHGKWLKDSTIGKGVDRHIFGLKCAVPQGQPMPAFLDDPLLKRSGYWTMSTSQIFGQHFYAYGWGAVVPEGHGFAYLIRESKSASTRRPSLTLFAENLQFTITSKTSQPNAELVANMCVVLAISPIVLI
jgi:carnitine O-acetyltransferase